MNYIDLFSGIGGFALGAYWAGMRFENHFFSDIEKFAVELYQKRFPDAIPLGDITKIDTDKLIAEYGTDWVLTGGFPCQDISIAGKGAGIEGKRSGLWFEYWRLIRDLRPRIAIMENVGALTFRGLDTVLGTLSEIGYNAEWQDIRAEDVGAPHRRERIWIIAYPNSTGSGTRGVRIDGDWAEKKRERRDKPQPEFSGHSEAQLSNPTVKRRECGETTLTGQYPQCEKRIFGRHNTRKISYPDSERCFHGQIGLNTAEGGEHAQRNTSAGSEEISHPASDTTRLDKSGIWGRLSGEGEAIRRDTNEEIPVERQGGLLGETHWSIEPAVGRLAHGIPRRVDRLKGLGNAIVPQIAMILWKQVKEVVSG